MRGAISCDQLSGVNIAMNVLSASFCCFISGYYLLFGARCSSVVRAFAHGAMGHRIDPSWGGPIELFLVPASAPQIH